MSDWAELSHRRADVYEWFSGVFAQELADGAIAAYLDNASAPLLRAFEAMGFHDEAQRVMEAVEQWRGVPDIRMELAADFARLFLFDGRDTAIPYASAYLDPEGQLYGEPQAQMQRFLQETGLQVHPRFNEPADHLSVALACFAARLRTDCGAPVGRAVDQRAAQLDFAKHGLLSWLPEFVGRCNALRPELFSDFYPALASLLLSFVVEDAASLEDADALS